MARRDMMKLGLAIRGVGYHVAAWRHPTVTPAGEQGFDHYLRVAEAAERGKFDMIFFADTVAIRESRDGPDILSRYSTLARIEPIVLLAAISARTSHVGLVATASTTYNHPYQVARKFASLDMLSGGRACWNLVTSWSDAEARNFGLEQQLDYGDRYERAREFLEVVLGLWDSWEDDAFLFDKEAGLFHDPGKLHALNHKGRHYSVEGPLNAPRSPQGRPIVCQAGASDAGQEISAATADIMYCAAQTREDARKFYVSVKERMHKYGRDESDLKILPGISPIIGRTEQEAREKFEGLQALIDPKIGLSSLSTIVGDLSAYPLDGPVPDLDGGKTLKSFTKMITGLGQKENMTIRQLYQAIAAGRGHCTIVGTAEQVADVMEDWFVNDAADGFNIVAAYLPQVIDDFVELVVPELQRRGLFRREYEGKTLRENLGLRRPANRYVKDAV